jgi:SAM-dependent methyltransferase
VKAGDYLIQKWRMGMAAKWVKPGSRILDIGCYQGEFLTALGDKIEPSVGFDSLYAGDVNTTRHQFFAQNFQEGLPLENSSFDAIVLLATMEHIRDKSVIAKEAARLLRAGGRVIITVPSPLVDKILEVLVFLHLVDGMSLEEHHGFIPEELEGIFASKQFQLIKKQKFQLGLNNLYVFERL